LDKPIFPTTEERNGELCNEETAISVERTFFCARCQFHFNNMKRTTAKVLKVDDNAAFRFVMFHIQLVAAAAVHYESAT